MRNLNRVAEAGTCPLGQVARQASIFGGMVMALHPPLKRKKNPQGPATSFVVACAFAPVAGALGYKGRTPFAQNARGGASEEAKADRSSFARMETRGRSSSG